MCILGDGSPGWWISVVGRGALLRCLRFRSFNSCGLGKVIQFNPQASFSRCELGKASLAMVAGVMELQFTGRKGESHILYKQNDL